MSEYYLSRINRSVDFIDKHLSEEIKIKQLADEACFSSFHFQRIYRAFKNESPYDTILRLRLERAVFHLKHFKKKRINEIAHEVGFASIENFSRQFKSHFGCSPSALRKDSALLNSRIYQENGSNSFHLAYNESRKQPQMNFQVDVQESAPVKVALIKAVFGADGSGLIEAYEHLMKWYEARGTSRSMSRRFGMSIDDPDVTPAAHYRYDYAVGINEPLTTEGLIENSIIPGGLYAVIHCQGDIHKVAQAWDFLYKKWLPESGYVPRHFPAIEEFLKGPEEIGWDVFDLLCKVPIEKI